MNWKHLLFGGLIFVAGLLTGLFSGRSLSDCSSSGKFVDARAWSPGKLAECVEINISIKFDGFPAEDGKTQFELSIKNLLKDDIIVPGDLVDGHKSELWEVRSLEGDLLAVRPYRQVEPAAVVLKPGQKLVTNPLWPNCPRLDVTEAAFRPEKYLIGLSKFGFDLVATGFEVNDKVMIVSN